jgi:SulP family sulfate permease
MGLAESYSPWAMGGQVDTAAGRSSGHERLHSGVRTCHKNGVTEVAGKCQHLIFGVRYLQTLLHIRLVDVDISVDYGSAVDMEPQNRCHVPHSKRNLRAMQIKGDLAGGITAALIPFPKAMALGAFIFSPLGPDFIPVGIVAGLVSLFVSNVTSSLLGAMPVMNNAPFSLSSFMLLAALSTVSSALGVEADVQLWAAAAIGLVFFTTSLSGVFQCLFGWLRLGDLAKYIPFPVLAGLINGSAIMIMLSQIKVVLGLPKNIEVYQIPENWQALQPLTAFVGVATIAAMVAGKRFSKRIPSPIFGLLGGSVLYYLMYAVGLESHLGSIIGTIPSVLPTPEQGLAFFRLLADTTYWPLVGKLVPVAIGIAAVNSLRSLVVETAGDNLMQIRTHSNRELIGQGCSNILSGVFGGISSAGSMSSTLANFQYGGRTAVSRAVSGIFPLLVLLLLHPLVSKIPHAVLGGLLIKIAVDALDRWSLRLPSTVRTAWASGDRSPAVNLILVATVSVMVILLGIIEALGIGLAISIGWFVVRMGKSGIRREFTADIFHSNTQRNEEEFALLETEGASIYVLELEGALFFGTADKIAAHVEKKLSDGTTFIVLDLKHVTEIDSTGAKQLMGKCHNKGATLYLSAVIESKPYIIRELGHFCAIDSIKQTCFQDIESALSVAEDTLLDDFLGRNRYEILLPSEKMEAFRLMTDHELAMMEDYLEQRMFAPRQTIFRQGDSGDGVYFIAKGRAQVLQARWDCEPQRIGTLCPGTSIGEMALVDQRPRSADVVASEEMICFHLSSDRLERLIIEEPLMAQKLIQGIAKELATRLRISNRIQTSLKT